MRLLQTLLAAATLALAGIAHAAPLTDAQIEGFAATLSEIEKVIDEYEAQGGATWDNQEMVPKAGETWAPMSGAIAEMKGKPYFGDVEAVIDSHGFDSAEQWGEIGDRITRAMVALELEEEDPDMRAEMEQAIAQIESNPNLSAEQKAMMRRSMEAAAAVLKSAADATPEDIAAVKPYQDLLSQAMDDEEEEG